MLYSSFSFSIVTSWLYSVISSLTCFRIASIWFCTSTLASTLPVTKYVYKSFCIAWKSADNVSSRCMASTFCCAFWMLPALSFEVELIPHAEYAIHIVARTITGTTIFILNNFIRHLVSLLESFFFHQNYYFATNRTIIYFFIKI